MPIEESIEHSNLIALEVGPQVPTEFKSLAGFCTACLEFTSILIGEAGHACCAWEKSRRRNFAGVTLFIPAKRSAELHLAETEPVTETVRGTSKLFQFRAALRVE
jgi:hypothetical protein